MAGTGATPGKRLSEAAWDAISEALAVFWWYKSGLSRFLHDELAASPELLARLDFEQTKRTVAAELVSMLRHQEDRYQGVAVDLLLKLGEFDEDFPWLARLDDAATKVEAAKRALADVRTVVAAYSDLARAREQVLAEAEERRASEEKRARVRAELDRLKQRFLELHAMTNPQARGKQLEGLLNSLFNLFDLDPRAAYNLEHEQIDGAFTFRTDDYILEARWWNKPLEPKHLNEFKGKVETKAKNVLGLLVSVNGFTDGAVKTHSTGTALALMDGLDLMAVLEGQIPLDEMLLRKRRHAAETGSPMLRASEMLD